jgi:dihydroneopterin aldolase
MRIKIKNLRLPTVVGVYERERYAPREIIANVTLTLPDHAGDGDELDRTVDYAELAEELRKTAEDSRYYLMEELGREFLAIASKPPMVQHVLVELDKPGAVPAAESISVSFEWTREDL